MATAAQLPVTQERASPIVVLRQNLTQMAPEFKMALPSHVTVEKFTRVALTAVQNNPDLLNCDRKSLFGAIVRLAQDGLLPDGREAALVMFGNKAQAMPMIAGVLKKIRQSGDVAKVSAQVVYEHDEFVWTLGFDEGVTHNPPPLDKPRGKAIGAYATAVLKDGSRLLEVMSLEEIEKVRAVSRAGRSGPWVQWWGEMARKTVMRRLSKRLPMSTDLEDALDRDPTMSPAGETIEHEPQPANDPPVSRLDALEQHIGADEAETAEFETEETDTSAAVADPPGEAGSANVSEQAAASEPEGGDKGSLVDRMTANADRAKAEAAGEGKPDADRGEAPTLDEAKAAVEKAKNADDATAIQDTYRGQLSDEDYLKLSTFTNNLVAERWPA